MPLLHAIGWSSEEDEKLVELVQPHSFLYNVYDPSRKNILARESTWQEIAEQLSKPVQECKKRWKGLRDGYTRTKRLGSMHKTRAVIFKKLQFLDSAIFTNGNEDIIPMEQTLDIQQAPVEKEESEQVITDNQEYYEITVVEGPHTPIKPPVINIIKPKPETIEDSGPPKKRCRKNAGRKKTMPVPNNIAPIKILPKPILMNGPKIVQYIEDPKSPEQRSQTIDKLIEKILKENTNEIDVFFRSMAASVKKLQPNLIPKVKMEVCNVIAKYEMQSFDKNLNF